MDLASCIDFSPTGVRRRSRLCCAWFGLGVLACTLALGGAARLAAQSRKPSEYDVKAAYLYNFGKFVDWPATTAFADGKNSFLICVLGQDPFGTALDSALARQSLNGKSVAAKRISKFEDAAGCRILFISSSESGQLKAILHAIEKEPVLTVSDLPQFAQRGGMIEFVLQEDRVRFEVNVANAESAGLMLSSELLKVALSVRRSQSRG